MDRQAPTSSRRPDATGATLDTAPVPGRHSLPSQLAAAPVPGRHSLTSQLKAWPGAFTPPVQRKLAVGGDPAAAAAPSLGAGTPLPAELRTAMEHAFATDFSAVRIHESASAGALGARAFARGNDLCFAPGQFDPSSAAGRELIGHELAHVVQQRQGRVSATTAQGDAGIVADAGLEAEADAHGARAARGERIAAGPAPATGGATAIQRRIACTDPGTQTVGWQMPEWGHWLDNRGIAWGDITGGGVMLPLVPNPPQANRLRSVAHHELLALQRAPNVHAFATLALVHAEVARRTATTLAAMIANGVAPGDLDVALDMYGRMDGRGPGDEAVLHKLEWHGVHHFQYEKQGVDPQQASQQGMVYGPWRDGLNAPSDNAGGLDVNVHTMPLNVVWLLACCHHGVSLRLYAPPTERGLFRQDGAGHVNNQTTNAPQRKLSALAREIIALVGTGMYNVAQHNDPSMPPGFQDTWLLTPTPLAFDATMAQLTVENNAYDLPQLTHLLGPRGIQVIQPNTPAANTVQRSTLLENKEGSLRGLWTVQMNAFSQQRVNLINTREGEIMAITGEPVHVMRRRVLGTVSSTFHCNYVTKPGQRLFVAGNLDELGGWDLGRARPLAYAGDHWTAAFTVCKDQTIHYKYILEDDQGRHWELGNDHIRNTVASATYQDNWGQG